MSDEIAPSPTKRHSPESLRVAPQAKRGGNMQALARRFAAPVFAFAMFASAALIFTLQPLFARMVTPLLGGSPAVWNTSMVFFQAALLAGYIYAHVLARLKDLRLQAAIHAAVLLIAWFVL